MTTLIPILAGSMIFFGTLVASAQKVEVPQEPNLFTLCAPVMLAVAFTEQEPGALGLGKDAIENAAESRLRAARLLAPTAKQVLFVNVTSTGPAFFVQVTLHRWVVNTGFSIGGTVAVWESSRLGTHGLDGQYVLGVVSQELDTFLAKYLRMNERHCATK